MKKLFLLLAFWPATSWAWMGFGGGTDYSRDAASTFICASTVTATTAAGNSASNPALTLVNPSGSGKNLVILETGIVEVAPLAFADFSLAYSTGATNGITFTTFTILTPALLAQTVLSTTTIVASATARCYRGAQLPSTPVTFRYLGTISTATVSGLIDSTNGKVVVPPGVVLSIQSTATASVLSHVIWREDNL